MLLRHKHPAQLSVTFASLALVVSISCCKQESVKQQQDAPRDAPVGRPVPPVAEQECPVFAKGRKIGKIESRGLVEASGFAASRLNPGILWSHNDSGGKAELWAMTFDGDDLGKYSLDGASAIDWEDIALGPGSEPGQWYVYVGDIGENEGKRQSVTVYRIVEPEVEPDQKDKKRRIADVTTLRLRYPTPFAPDAEALMVDPSTSDLYVVTKVNSRKPRLFRATAPYPAEGEVDFVESAVIKLPKMPSKGSYRVTAGDISADGRWVLLRTYSHAYLWSRPSGVSVVDAMRQEPCLVPLEKEQQGEAIAWAPSGLGYFTVSEGRKKPIYFFSRH